MACLIDSDISTDVVKVWNTSDRCSLYVVFPEERCSFYVKHGIEYHNFKNAFKHLLSKTNLSKLEFCVIDSIKDLVESIHENDELSLSDIEELLRINGLYENVRIISKSNFKHLVGKEIQHPYDFVDGITFLYENHDEDHISIWFVKKFVEKRLIICPYHNVYYDEQCVRCLNKESESKAENKYDKIMEKENEDLFVSIPIDKQVSDGIYLSYMYDFETYTTLEGTLIPIMACVSISFFCFSPDEDFQLTRDHEFWFWLSRQCNEIMVSHGFTIVKSYEGGVEAIPDSLCYSIIWKPQYNSYPQVGRSVVTSQNALFDFLRENHKKFNQELQVNVKNFVVVSGSFNGSKFDELFLVNHRLFAKKVVDKYQYFMKGGGIYRMNRRETEKGG